MAMIKTEKGSDMISAIEAIKAINDIRSSEVVVATMTANRYWESVSQNPVHFPSTPPQGFGKSP